MGYGTFLVQVLRKPAPLPHYFLYFALISVRHIHCRIPWLDIICISNNKKPKTKATL